MTNAGLADYDGVEWDKTEPHIRHQHHVATTDLSAYDFVVAAQALERLSRQEVARWGRDFDVLLTPTSAILPPAAGSVLAAQHATPASAIPEVVGSVAFTAFANVTGLPSLSVPLHWTPEGVPVGVMLTGGPFDETTLVRLGAQLEQARPWADKRPPAVAAV
jgi:amidase